MKVDEVKINPKIRKKKKREDRRTAFGFALVMPGMSCSPTN